MDTATIEAAGVVLVRPGADGPEVAVVHRPRRSDWSMPKGKLDPGERHDVAAVRETLEETGVRSALGPSLGQRRYLVGEVPKRVRYWRATVLTTQPREPDDEVDEVRWVTVDAAHALLTYEDDRRLVEAALALPDTAPTIVLRHAEAVKRAPWRGSGDPLADVDAARPLDEAGIHQAHDLVELLGVYAPRYVVSSDARRCRATVEPYASEHGLPLHLEHALSEEGHEDDPEDTAAVVARLLEAGGPAVWCTHRPVLPQVMETVASVLGVDGSRLDPRLRPGAGTVLHRDRTGGLVAVDRFQS